jgi:hypothetical protein
VTLFARRVTLLPRRVTLLPAHVTFFAFHVTLPVTPRVDNRSMTNLRALTP